MMPVKINRCYLCREKWFKIPEAR